jgi:hypothetical protein
MAERTGDEFSVVYATAKIYAGQKLVGYVHYTDH